MDAIPEIAEIDPDLRRIADAAADDRKETLEAAKVALKRSSDTQRERFFDGVSALDTMAARADAVDAVIRALLDHAADKVFPAANPTTGERFAVIAVGGYGRGLLAPYSDIDLLFLTPYKRASRVEQMVEHTLYLLWDLGLKVGHATRSVEDCVRLAKTDMTIRTSLLEMRPIWGEARLADELRDAFWNNVANDDARFMAAKLEEREDRHASYGDSRYMLEPNVKEGKGAIRDLHALYWIAKHHYHVQDADDLVDIGVFSAGERRRFRKAAEFLTSVRCHLHYWAGRPEERLTFDAQVAIAERMGYADRPHIRGVERFMKHYYLTVKTVGDLTRILCAALEAAHTKPGRFSLGRLLKTPREIEGFDLISGRLAVRDDDAFRNDPIAMLRIFHVAERLDLDIHPGALRLIRRDLKKIDTVREDPEANRLFLELLTSKKTPSRALGRLNEAAVLGRFVPDFGRVVAQMQYDMYHTYTVDEHTIRAIGMLSALEKGELKGVAPVASEVVSQTQSRRALFVALFLHDIAKGRGGDHSILGAEVAQELCPRLGLDAGETDTVAWLVRHHLVMSRDPADPQTVRDFVDIVQSLERLRLLLALTVCDIRAVGPNTWTEWKASLLRDLYFRAQEAIAGGDATKSVKGRIERAKDEVAGILSDWAPDALQDALTRPPAGFWLSADAAELARRLRVYERAKASDPPLVIEVRPTPEGDATEVIVATPDHPGLFARIAGGLALAGVDIVQSQAATFGDGLVLDVFAVSSSPDEDLERRDDRIKACVRDALSGKVSLSKALHKPPPWRRRVEAFSVAPQVFVDNKASRTHTVIEVVGRDRPGFLNKIAWTLTQQGLQIAQSRISTYGERAVDVFYVKDVFGLKVEQEVKIAAVRKALLQALEELADLGSGCAASRSEIQLVAFVARDEAEAVVEPMGVGAAFVGRELHETAAALAASPDRPFEHRLPETAAALVPRDADGLDLPARHAAAREAGNKGQLQRADDAAVRLRDREELVRIGRDRGEGRRVARVEIALRRLPSGAQRVVGQQGDDRRQVPRFGAPEDRGTCRRVRHCAVRPPSTTRPAPVMKPASSEARKQMPFAMSSATPRRPIGWVEIATLRAASTSFSRRCAARATKVCAPMSVSITPGWIEFTRMR